MGDDVSHPPFHHLLCCDVDTSSHVTIRDFAMNRHIQPNLLRGNRLIAGIALAFLGVWATFSVYSFSESTCAPRSTAYETVISDSQLERLPYSANALFPNALKISPEALGVSVVQDSVTSQYAHASTLLKQGESLSFTAEVPADGTYFLWFDVAVHAESPQPEGQLRLNSLNTTSDIYAFTLPIYYRNSTDTFPVDRYGNDALISQVRDVRWSTATIWDSTFSQPTPTQLTLSNGKHTFQFTLVQGTAYIGTLFLVPFSPYPSYDTYLTQHPATDSDGVLLTIEAERPTYKNSTSVRPNTDRSLAVTPYDTYCQLLNTLGGDSWKKSGTTVFYEINVPQTGFYALTLRALQSTRSNFTVFRRITVNGIVPFDALNAVPFDYSAGWVDHTLPHKIFLEAGSNIIGIEATNAPYLRAIETIQDALLDINALSLEVRRLTGNQRDPFKEWQMTNYIPDIRERLNQIAQNLTNDKDALLSGEKNASPERMTYQIAIDNLLFLAQDPNQIPTTMSRLSEGSGSSAQLLGSLLPLLQDQPLALDKLFVHSPNLLPPTPTVPIATSLLEDYRRFLYSFKPSPFQSLKAQGDELDVWVNRPRQYVNLLQLMADTSFTPQTGTRVKFSIMPDQTKLILANVANIQPDIALGISTNIPSELAVRNALYDLRRFPGFDSFIRIYSPGALLAYILNESVYALPETQDFWVTYYRKDILNSLNIPVPNTWNDVLAILPELQRYGMNYATPLSSGSGLKGYLLTAPYLFNYGATLYSDDGLASGLQSESAISAIQFMADSFTIYGMPLTTANFYQDFRYGTVPIGISNMDTYIKLVTTAPEISGAWDIGLYPATVLADGTQNRYATGSAQASIMFANTDKPQEGWQFLQWWMSAETQSEFQEQLILNYGREYLWFSANLEAFESLAIPENHRATILEQWQWLQEPVRPPASYMQERELSNVWNRIVFDGVNTRVALDRAIILINREITRKMEETGYLQDGKSIRTLKLPTIETVIGWIENAK